jgi:uncharacterized repeat protein (TIGR02543 family)
VAGAAALIKARHPEYVPGQIRAVLRGTARPTGALPRNDNYGWGILDAYGAALGVERLYSVSFDYGDDEGEREPLIMWVVPGGRLEEPAYPLRGGYVFAGWYKNASGGEKFDFSQAINGDTTVYAQWIKAAITTFATEFPDAGFCAEVLAILGGGKKSGDIVSMQDYANLAAISTLNISRSDIYDLTGLRYFSGLTELDCSYNLLTELDISKNTGLTVVICSGNSLTALDISHNSALKRLQCSLNYLLSEDSISGLAAIRDKLTLSFNPQKALIRIIAQPPPLTAVTQGSISGSLSMEILATQGAALKYQWYSSSGPANSGGAIIEDAAFAEFPIPENLLEGIYYYYCEITASNSISSASALSDAATVTVGAPAATISLSGDIIYQDSPVPATVSLYSCASESADFTTTTKADGSYAFTIPAAAAGAGYTLVVTKPGYLSYTVKNFNLTEEEGNETIDIRQLAGDVNGDGIVNAVDLTCLLSEFNRTPLAYEFADIDGNGIVNAADLTYLLAGFNKRNVEIER